MSAPFQLALGGANGVRSHVDYELPAARTLVMRVEEQWNPGLFEPNADVGLTFFADVGRGWAGAVPFGTDSGWRHGAGAGLRLGFPAGTGTVLRVEVAWPTSDGAGGTVFRAYWSKVETSR